MRRPLEIALVALCVLGARAAPARACTCFGSDDLAADVREADSVFAGEVVALELLETKVGDAVLRDMVATFRVSRRWKGVQGDRVKVKTCGTQTEICSCGVAFELGKRFVVFASGEPLVTGGCTRTQAFIAAPGSPDFQWMGVEDLVRALDAETRGNQ
jgi:hypothetical protein